MFKTPPCNEGDLGSIPGQGAKIPDAAKLLSPDATTAEAAGSDYWAGATQPQFVCCDGKTPRAAIKTWHSEMNI